MIQPSPSLQQALSKALLEILASPDLKPREWLQQFALRTITEFSVVNSKRKKDTPEEPLAA